MAFRVHGIKQLQHETIQVSFVVRTDSSLLARKLLEKYNILLLSLTEYTHNIESFGDIRAKVAWWFDGIILVLEEPSLEVACEKLLSLWLHLVEINSFSHPIPKEQMQSLLDIILSHIQEHQAINKEVQEKKQEAQKKIYLDPKLEKAKQATERIFQRLLLLEPQLTFLPTKELSYIKVLKDELKKLRMGNNYEKIFDVAGQLLRRMLDAEQTLLLTKNNNTSIVPWSVVTEKDVELQEVSLLYAKQKKLLGFNISLFTDDYALFGNISLFWRFLQKDFLALFRKPEVCLYYIYDLLLLFVSLLLIFAGGFVIYNFLWPTLDRLESFRLEAMKIWVLGLLLRIGSFWKKMNIYRLIFLFLAIWISYWILTKLIIINFALVP